MAGIARQSRTQPDLDSMAVYLVERSVFLEWIGMLARHERVYFPQPVSESSFRFNRVGSRSLLALEDFDDSSRVKPFRASACVPPPVRSLAPDNELLFTFRRDKAGDCLLAPVLDNSRRILAGVRPCDLKAIALMDRFQRAGIPDPYYLARRDHTLIIGHDCLQPCDEYCFCEAAGSLAWREGADIFLTPQPQARLLVEPLTDQGAVLLADAGFPICEDVKGCRARAAARRATPFGRRFAAPLAQVMQVVAGSWDSAVWEQHADRCFSCGTCNLVCPTCSCFDVRDDFNVEDPGSGRRTRRRDACMLEDFAEVAGGHNFRKSTAARQRHRVMRKFVYLPDRFGGTAFCVGCGRCRRQCTVAIDIFDIATDLLAGAGEGT